MGGEGRRLFGKMECLTTKQEGRKNGKGEICVGMMGKIWDGIGKGLNIGMPEG